jgi:hypothetical protein
LCHFAARQQNLIASLRLWSSALCRFGFGLFESNPRREILTLNLLRTLFLLLFGLLVVAAWLILPRQWIDMDAPW